MFPKLKFDAMSLGFVLIDMSPWLSHIVRNERTELRTQKFGNRFAWKICLEIRAHVAEQIADYKVPESLTIVGEIPRNALGKVDRKLLLQMISECERQDTSLLRA